jgi:hypothetical protein
MKYRFKRFQIFSNFTRTKIFECNECGYTGRLGQIKVHTKDVIDIYRKHPNVKLCKGNFDNLI